ncbi:MAG: class I SAM-dependent methyltransferase [Oscillospiraceae bacterium]|nr:class I SAM-dependent methyltransferase [Oscillospiraceae bacterium]
MSKYDFELDLSLNSSTGLLLNKINKGDIVLEFGCATGRMTRYMQQELGCKVYIVEYEKSAFETALQYAEDGVCGDILKFEWLEKFKDIKFDAILFADVLEHLSVPEKVLKCASELLKSSGHIYASVPNITHNDIILKSYNEHFDYTSTGILDDTHIHFWGLENIKDIGNKSGLFLEKVEATYCGIQETEQFENAALIENKLLFNMLRERTGGHIYQFVFTLSKDDKNCDTQLILKAPSIRSHIYYDCGDGFIPDNIIGFDSFISENGSYKASCYLENTDNIKRLRFDPVEGQDCIIKNISITQNGEELEFLCPDSIKNDDGIFLMGADPTVCIERIVSGKPLIIEAEILILGSKYVEYIHNSYVKGYADLQNRIEQLKKESADFERRLGAYISVANNKDKYTMKLEQRVAELSSLKYVKAYIFIRKVLIKIKNKLKKLYRKWKF